MRFEKSFGIRRPISVPSSSSQRTATKELTRGRETLNETDFTIAVMPSTSSTAVAEPLPSPTAVGEKVGREKRHCQFV
jgi:hypothetical protein